MYRINDHSLTPTPIETKVSTSLNHTINFHVHDGFRADELTYIEVETPWAKDGRAMMTSSIFAKDGTLIATCTQEVCVDRHNMEGMRN
jgi:acyl-coenzyme A thioesterase 1/2/4